MKNNLENKSNFSHTLISNVIYNYIGFFYVSISGFLLFPFSLHILGQKVNGVLLLINSILNYFSILDLGVATTVMKMVAEHTHDKNKTEITKIVVNALIVFIVIAIIMVIFGLALLPLFGNVFKIPREILFQAKISYIIYIIAVGSIFPTAIFQALFSGYQNYKINNIISIVQTTISILGSIFVLIMGYGIIGLSLVTLISNTFVLIARVYITLFRYKINIFAFNLINRKILRSIFLFSRWILLITVASRLIFQSDVIIIGIFATAVAITRYQIALSPNVFLRAIGDQFNNVTLTASANLHSQKNFSTLQRLLKESTRVTAITMLPFVIVFFVWGRDYITLWVGKSYISSYYTLIVLTIGIFAATIEGTSDQIIIALNKQHIYAFVTALEAIFNVILSVILLPKIGIIGVAIGTTLPALTLSLGFALFYASRLIQADLWSVYAQIIRPVLIAVPFAILAYIFNKFVAIHNFIELFIFSGILYLLYFTVALLIEPNERKTYVNLLKNFGTSAYELFFGIINQTND